MQFAPGKRSTEPIGVFPVRLGDDLGFRDRMTSNPKSERQLMSTAVHSVHPVVPVTAAVTSPGICRDD